MSQSSPPQTLDRLFRAEEFARFSLRARGKVPPALLALGPDGPLFFLPSTLADERAKDNFATTARLICIAHTATAAVMILEAWMKLNQSIQGARETRERREMDRQRNKPASHSMNDENWFLATSSGYT